MSFIPWFIFNVHGTLYKPRCIDEINPKYMRYLDWPVCQQVHKCIFK